MAGLSPPHINTQDPGAHDLSESDDHFSSASEGNEDTPNRLSTPATPTTRVERVDDRPAHGEVPGTAAYALRTRDAVPDELEIVPEGRRSRSATQSRSRAASTLSVRSGAGGEASRPQTPGETPIPKTIVERVDDKPAHGEVEGTEAYQMRLQDAEPDEVRQAPREARSGVLDEGREDSEQPVGEESRQAWFRSMWEGDDQKPRPEAEAEGEQQETEESNDDEDDFGDDFNEFNEGGGDDDFGDFDEADEEATPLAEAQHQPPPPPDILAGLPPLNLSDLSPNQIQNVIAPYITAIFPTSPLLPPLKDLPAIDPTKISQFLSDRSLSLWQQLVSPPPMQPPNWTRSRIRRLFLVSLGVPVDLDEILPPSKQKRLVLPNMYLLPITAEARPSNALDRLRDQNGNDSTTSLDSKTGQPKRPSSRKPKGPPPPPDFDLNSAALLCSTTEQAMQGMEDSELQRHLLLLGELNERASRVLEYWLQRKDEGVKEKEALEGVIENLVGFVKGRRGM